MERVANDEDIKELKLELEKTKAKLREKELLFDSIIETTLAGYWIWELKGEDVYISPQLKSMLGYEDHELPNHISTINSLMHPSDLPDSYTLLDKHIKSNGEFPFENEVRYRHKDGSIVWVICTGNIVKRDEDGNPEIMVGCHIDNTALKKAERIQKYVDELERKNVELEQFAYIASHDLQEPLNTIKGFVNLLGLEKVSAEAREYLNLINESSTRMTNLIRGLLEYSQIGKDTLIKKVDLNTLVSEVLKDLSSTIRKKHASVEVDSLPVIRGYDLELRVLFQNLISNALKFQGTEAPRIRISVEQGKDHFTFSVADNGIGIDPKYSDKIFKLYQRLHSRGTYEGNGLGLAKCYKIVTELHNGKLWVEPNEDQGSIFRFTIPSGA